MFDLYQIANRLLINTQDESLGKIRVPYLIFNAVEAFCWLTVALAVLWRYAKHRKSPAEIGYSLSFLAFALSDVVETSGTTLLLLLFKGVCLLAIQSYRRQIKADYGSRMF